MMTAGETQEYVERRLRELGWAVRIGNTAYEKIYRFTDGTEAGVNQVCYKLLSLGSLQSEREITDVLVHMALDDLARMDDIVKRSATKATASGQGGDGDIVSIEQLAAELEERVANERTSDPWTPNELAQASDVAIVARATTPSSRKVTEKPFRQPKARVSPPPPPPPTFTEPTTYEHDVSSPRVSQADRFSPERDMHPGRMSPPVVQGTFLQRLSTTAITLTATILVVGAIALILYIHRNGPDVLVTSAPPAPVAPTEQAPAPTPAPPPTAYEPDVSATPDLPSAAPAQEVPAPAPPTLTKKEVSTPKSSEHNAKEKVDESHSSTVVRQGTNSADKAVTAKAETARAAVPAVKPPEIKPEVAAPVAPPPVVAKIEKPVEVAPVAPVAKEAPIPTPAPVPAEDEEPALSAPTATKPAASASARPALMNITQEELAILLRRFAQVYEAGDVDQFVGLFADNARTNDQTTRKGIRQDYDTFFRTTDVRQISLGHVNWEVEDNQAHGWGNFDVKVRRTGEEEPQTFAGSLSFYVEKVDGRLRIVRLYHGQRRAGL
ncbi:MAG: hypothetical protein HY308_15155 [Gammaproteobacteria bacterium]|nr:hypothetical protein [Gammaproteobacteria bacterium]